jgi:hypothetical protein
MSAFASRLEKERTLMPLTIGSPMGPIRLQLVPDDAHSSCKLGGRPPPLRRIREIGMGGACRTVGLAGRGPKSNRRRETLRRGRVCSYARSRMFATLWAYHCPPRAVAMPRALRSSLLGLADDW